MKITEIVKYDKYHKCLNVVGMRPRDTLKIFKSHDHYAVLSLESLEIVLKKLGETSIRTDAYKLVKDLVWKLKEHERQ